MSALLAQATAIFQFKDASVTLSCSSPEELLNALAKFGIASNDPVPAAGKPAATPAPTAAPKAQPEGNASASTSTPAGAQPAAAGSTSAGDAPPTYEDVKDRVLRLSKVKRELALETLGAFKTVGGEKVDHGNKLQLPDYPAFIKAADEKLGAAA